MIRIVFMCLGNPGFYLTTFSMVMAGCEGASIIHATSPWYGHVAACMGILVTTIAATAVTIDYS